MQAVLIKKSFQKHFEGQRLGGESKESIGFGSSLVSHAVAATALTDFLYLPLYLFLSLSFKSVTSFPEMESGCRIRRIRLGSLFLFRSRIVLSLSFFRFLRGEFEDTGSQFNQSISSSL